MFWIRGEDCNGQKVFDEVVIGESIYVQVKDPQDAIVFCEEENQKKGKTYGQQISKAKQFG